MTTNLAPLEFIDLANTIPPVPSFDRAELESNFDPATVPDSTSAFQAVLDQAATEKRGVICSDPNRAFKVDTLLITDGVRSLDLKTTGCVIVGAGTNTTAHLDIAVLRIKALDNAAEETVNDLRIHVEMDMQLGDRSAIIGSNCQSCNFSGTNIYGFTEEIPSNPSNLGIYNHRGIRLDTGSSFNILENCEITGFEEPEARGLLIDIWGEGQAFGGFVQDEIVRADNPAIGNIVKNSILKYGSYAINAHHCEHNRYEANHCEQNDHRNIYLANTCYQNKIINNYCLNGKSSSILLGYGASLNTVSGNICTNTSLDGSNNLYGANGEAAIQATTGAKANVISDNYISTPHNFGIYIATGATDSLVINNYIENSYVAFLAAENDWVDPQYRPANSYGLRPNFGAAGSNFGGRWAHGDLQNVVFKNNTFGKGYMGRSVIAMVASQVYEFDGLAQEGETPPIAYNTKDIIFSGNILTSMENVGQIFKAIESSKGGLINVKLIDTKLNTDDEITFSKFGTGGIASLENCLTDVTDTVFLDNHLNALFRTLPSGNSPDITPWSSFQLAPNQTYDGSEISVPVFSNLEVGKVYLVRGNTGAQILVGGSFRSRDGQDIIANSTNMIFSIMKMSNGVVFEVT